jgi:ATP-dependent Lhr-like helicase
VVLADGEPVLFVERGASRVFAFAPREPHREAERVAAAVRALARAARAAGGRRLRVERIDDAEAAASPWAPVFVEAGFRRGYKGLELDRL